MKICTQCNLSYDDDKKFCKICGNPLVLEVDTKDAGISDSPPTPPYNSVIDAQKVDKTLETPKKTEFDFFGWVSKYKMVFLIILGLVIVLFAKDFFFLKHDPIMDGKKALEERCNCESKFNSNVIQFNNKLEKSIKNGLIKNPEEIKKFYDLKKLIATENTNCNKKSTQKYLSLKKRYISDKQLLYKFDSIFINTPVSDWCDVVHIFINIIPDGVDRSETEILINNREKN